VSARSAARRASHLAALLAVSLPLLTGCYTTRPVRSMPAPEQFVFISLTEAGTISLARSVGPHIATIHGRVLAVKGDTLDVALREMVTDEGEMFKLSGASVRLLPFQVKEMRRRQVSAVRTLTMVGLAGLGVSIVSTRVRDGERP
jgi:hypothetical protein